MAEPPHEFAPLFTTERARLLELLAGLGPADWQRPSPCPGWTVLDLCAHLAGDDLGFLARHRDGYFGTQPPGLDGEDAFAVWLDRLQAQWVEAARRMSPRIVTDLLAWSGPQIEETLRGEDPRALTASVSWAGPDPVPAWVDQVRELSEYWIHRQQLLQALGRPSDLRADVAGPVLDGLRLAYPYRLARVPGEPGDTVTVAVSGPVARTWFLVAAGSGWKFRDQPGGRGAAAVSMTTDQAWRLLTNNLPPAARSRIAASGDRAVLDVIFRTRAIIGIPQ